MTTIKPGRILGWVVAVGVTLTMAACSSPSGSSSASASGTGATISSDSSSGAATDLPSAPTPTIVPSTTLDGITVTGNFGDAPTVTVPSPWAIDSTKTEVLAPGSGGQTVNSDSTVLVNYYGVDGRTGQVFDQSWSRGAPASIDLTQVVPGFQKGLTGQQVNSRVLIAMPGADGYDSAGGQPNAGINIGDTLVFVVDILRSSFDQPTGTPVTVTDSTLPTVSTPCPPQTQTPSATPNPDCVNNNDINNPVLTFPATANPPTSLVVQPLITGPGPNVAATDTVTINYAEYMWDNNQYVRQTYGFGAPLKGTLSSTIQGWQQALVNQPMGSRLLVVVPPSLAYPQGNTKIGVPANTTMVYIIDILYADPTPSS